jgi:hypothetical protein
MSAIGLLADKLVAVPRLVSSGTETWAARRPTGIVKLIRHTKSTDAAHRCPTLLNGEEAAICGAPSLTRIFSAPTSIVAGQSGGGRLRQHYRQHNEGRYFSCEVHCKASELLLKLTT